MAIANQNGNGTLSGGPITIQANAENVVKQMLARGKAYPDWNISQVTAVSFKFNSAHEEEIRKILKEVYHCNVKWEFQNSKSSVMTILPVTFRFE
jgi:hypothetical protein